MDSCSNKVVITLHRGMQRVFLLFVYMNVVVTTRIGGLTYLCRRLDPLDHGQ